MDTERLPLVLRWIWKRSAACLVILLAVSAADAQGAGGFVVLPQSAANRFAGRQLCSRPGPPRFSGTFAPTDADIHALESRLPQISQLRTHEGPLSRGGQKIENPSAYHRQYLGIRVGKRNLIYVNAFDEFTAKQIAEDDRHKLDWRSTPVIGCDGGNNFWGAVYDPATGTFSDLEINLSLGW
jgi:hypothetical protein